MKNQNSYLPGKIDLEQAVGPGNYLASYFTVEPSDYPEEFRDDRSYTKELFTTFTYNKSSGFYETLFRGAKIILKKRSNLSNSVADSLDKYIPKYRNYEDYKFAAILRPISEDDDNIQDPVKYRIIENQSQRFINLWELVTQVEPVVIQFWIILYFTQLIIRRNWCILWLAVLDYMKYLILN
jgi:hypothetical protein